MNRRKMFSFLAVAPIAGGAAVAAIKEASAAAPVLDAVESKPILGELKYWAVAVPDYSGGSHSHSPTFTTGVYPSVAQVRVKIYNGQDWVDFESEEGVAAHNKALRALIDAHAITNRRRSKALELLNTRQIA